MKRNFIKLTGVALISALALTACHPDKVKEEAAMAAILSLAIRSSASGNCAVSLNLGTLYSGAIIQAAVNNTATFTQADYEQASGTTVGTGQTYTTYASVPYNVKYDAFIKGGGTYDATARNTDINTGKLETLKNAYLGVAAATCLANGTATANTPATGFRSGSAAVSGSLSASEITDLTAYIAANPIGGQTTFAAIEAGVITASCSTFIANVGGQATAASLAGAYQGRQAFATGAAILACGRIPKSSCTFAALTTADRATAIKNGVSAIENIANNSDCRKTNSDFLNFLVRSSFTGTPKGTVISGFTFSPVSPAVTASPTDPYVAISEGTTAPTNKIFAESAYPVSTALSAISTNFNIAFPLVTGTIKQTESTIAYYKASNIGVTSVESCESLGFPGYGPSNGSTATSTHLAAKKDLTPVKEIAYAFSSENTAASLYAAVRGAVQDTQDAAGADAIACNNSFRSRFSIPLAIGGGKLPVLNNAVSGNGGATSTLTTCVYGGSATSRGTSASLLGSTLAGITSCATAAAPAAAKFGDTGLDTLADFPNN